MDVALAALFLLGGSAQLFHVEDIALRAFALAPTRFSWTKHPEHPDLSVAREALYDAYRSDRRGSRLVRRTQKGTEWALTAEGVAYVQREGQDWVRGAAPKTSTMHQEVQRIVHDVAAHPAYAAYRRAKRITSVPAHQIADMFRVALDTDEEKVTERVEQLRASARVAARPELERFIAKAGEHLLAERRGARA